MPYRNKEDQAACYRRWYLQHKEERDRKSVEFMRVYTTTPEARQKRKEYRARPEVRAREQELRRSNYLSINGRQVRVQKRPRTNDICEVCGRTEVKKMGYHHWDDEHPEQGVWVCFPCHKMAECMDAGLGGAYLVLKQSIIG